MHSLNITECSTIPQLKISHRIETKQSTCNAHQLIDLSLHQKGLFNSPEYKHLILYKIHKYDFKSIQFT